MQLLSAKNIEKGRVFRRAPTYRELAAATVVVAATAATVVAACEQATATAVAQQDEDQDDPANITAAETVIVTHNPYLRNFLR